MPLTQSQKDKISARAESSRVNIIRNHQANSQEEMLSRLDQLAMMLKEEIEFDGTVLALDTLLDNHLWSRELYSFIYLNEGSEDGLNFYLNEDNPLLRSLFHPSFSNTAFHYGMWQAISTRLTFQPFSRVEPFIRFLLQQGFGEDEIIQRQIEISSHPFHLKNIGSNSPLNGFAEYVRPLLEDKKGFFGLGGKRSKAHLIQKTLFDKKHRTSHFDLGILRFFYDINPELVEEEIPHYVISLDHNHRPFLSLPAVRFLLERNSARYEKVIFELLNQVPVQLHELFEIYSLLHQYTPVDRSDLIKEIGEQYLTSFKSASPGLYYIDMQVNKPAMSVAYIGFLLAEDEQNGKNRIVDYLRNYEIVFPHFLTYIDEIFKEDSVPFLVEAIGKDPKWVYGNFYKTLFGILDQYDYKPYIEKAFQYVIHKASKEDRETICLSLAKQGGIAITKAKELLTGKTVNERISAALILSHIDSPDIKTLLQNSLDIETNDDTRNIILEALRDENPTSPDHHEILSMIKAAEARKKLNKWNEKNLTEESLPPLYWKNGEALKEAEIRFLFYRMKQSKGMNSDVEARETIKQIDKARSEKFASHLLQAFIDSNADSKLKYYLTLSGMLGGDMILHKLNALFRKSLADKRVKMAEYALGAIAMVGSDKALRILEVISRKFANKKPQLSKVALESLDASAKELNISQEQLADRIVPDFGFGGLYKEFKAGDETYRAVINGDFKLCFYDENRKLRKSAPANTDKETLTEFKEIEKEIREVVRTQNGRLEKCMIEGRSWEVTEWKNLFFNNPIMFVYATKLIWSLFDEKDQLVTVFYCDDDMEALDINDEAVELNEGHYIRVLHPTDLSTDQIQQWKDKVYHSNLKTIFPILERSVFEKNESEYELNLTKAFYNEEVPKGADFVISHLTKCGWRKESGDGGSVTLTKHLFQPVMHAYAYIEGPQVVYQGGTAKATVYEIMFMGKNHNSQIKIKDVPKRFYSETIADIDAMIKAN